jgi:hypothetical protein
MSKAEDPAASQHKKAAVQAAAIKESLQNKLSTEAAIAAAISHALFAQFFFIQASFAQLTAVRLCDRSPFPLPLDPNTVRPDLKPLGRGGHNQ